MHRSTLFLAIFLAISFLVPPVVAGCNCAVGYKCENNQCRACDGGYSSNGGSATQCFQCQANTFSTPGTACTPCPAGKGQTQPGRNSCDTCTAGTFSTEGSGCKTCPSGQVSKQNGATTCSACDPGSIPNTAHSFCELCPGGKIAPNAGMATCTPCPMGYYQSATGSTYCIICPCGWFNFREGATSCDPCPTLNGKFTTSPKGSFYQSACHNLKGGQYADKDKCEAQCPSDQISTDPPSDHCQVCPNGLYPNGDQNKCVPKTSPKCDKKRGIPFCPPGHQACPIIGSKGSYECIDTSSDIESCGGCSSDGTGMDCSAYDLADSVSCVKGRCQYECPFGYESTATGCNKTSSSTMRISGDGSQKPLDRRAHMKNFWDRRGVSL